MLGGIGENAPTVRARICDGLGFLGIELEEKRNAANEGVISAVASRVAVRVMHTDEEVMIAKSVCHVLGLPIEKEHEQKTVSERSIVIKVKNVVKENIPAVATLSHFPAVLCVWACAAQIKRDELRRQFGEQIPIEYHFLRLCGDVSARIDAGWGDRGGAAEHERFSAVKRVVAQTEQGLDAAARAGNAREEAG